MIKAAFLAAHFTWLISSFRESSALISLVSLLPHFIKIALQHCYTDPDINLLFGKVAKTQIQFYETRKRKKFFLFFKFVRKWQKQKLDQNNWIGSKTVSQNGIKHFHIFIWADIESVQLQSLSMCLLIIASALFLVNQHFSCDDEHSKRYLVIKSGSNSSVNRSTNDV